MQETHIENVSSCGYVHSDKSTDKKSITRVVM